MTLDARSRDLLDRVILSGIAEGEKKEVLSQLEVSLKGYKKGEIVFMEGDHIISYCIVAGGQVLCEKYYENGECHILETYEEGSLFATDIAMSRTGLSMSCFRCGEESTVLFVDAGSVEESTCSNVIKKNLYQSMADESVRRMHKVEILALRSLRGRIMLYLDILSRKAGCNTVTVQMNREQLAQYLGVNRSALSTELNKLRSEKKIEIRRKRFTIL